MGGPLYLQSRGFRNGRLNPPVHILAFGQRVGSPDLLASIVHRKTASRKDDLAFAESDAENLVTGQSRCRGPGGLNIAGRGCSSLPVSGRGVVHRESRIVSVWRFHYDPVG
jgi:hypothetical protein